MLDKHPHDLGHYMKNDLGVLDVDMFMAGLESAVQHLHSLGFAHNDVNPANILVDKVGMPVLVDFGSRREIGRKLTSKPGHPRMGRRDRRLRHLGGAARPICASAAQDLAGARRRLIDLTP